MVVLKHVDFSWCSSPVVLCYGLELVPEHGHDVVPLNLCRFVRPAMAPVPLLCSALASTSFNCVWKLRQVTSIMASIMF
jgi:hypothetical protein